MARRSTRIVQLLALGAVAACAAGDSRGVSGSGDTSRPAASSTDSTSPMNQIAESYVKLALAVGKHDADYVDAYYGPSEWKAQADSATVPLPEIEQQANALIGRLGDGSAAGADTAEMTRLRHAYLRRQLEAMVARVKMLQGTKLSDRRVS